jgi:hypothetical protein
VLATGADTVYPGPQGPEACPDGFESTLLAVAVSDERAVPWTAPGGDYSEDPAATLDVGGEGFYTWTSNELLVDLVDSWKRFPFQNFGMLVRGDEGSSGSVKRFESRENPDPARRPVLIVEFARCPADFNQDGGVDGGDVADFFETWSQGASAADVNLDGGVDGSDIDAFFVPWEAGGC